jgi:hypothetical protein
MEPTSGNADIDRFLLELMRSSWMLCDLAENLVDGLREDAFPGTSPGAAVVEMMFGTMAGALTGVDATDLLRATELIELTLDRVIQDLRLAYELSRRMHGDGEVDRNFG